MLADDFDLEEYLYQYDNAATNNNDSDSLHNSEENSWNFDDETTLTDDPWNFDDEALFDDDTEDTTAYDDIQALGALAQAFLPSSMTHEMKQAYLYFTTGGAYNPYYYKDVATTSSASSETTNDHTTTTPQWPKPNKIPIFDPIQAHVPTPYDAWPVPWWDLPTVEEDAPTGNNTDDNPYSHTTTTTQGVLAMATAFSDRPYSGHYALVGPVLVEKARPAPPWTHNNKSFNFDKDNPTATASLRLGQLIGYDDDNPWLLLLPSATPAKMAPVARRMGALWSMRERLPSAQAGE